MSFIKLNIHKPIKNYHKPENIDVVVKNNLYQIYNINTNESMNRFLLKENTIIDQEKNIFPQHYNISINDISKILHIRKTLFNIPINDKTTVPYKRDLQEYIKSITLPKQKNTQLYKKRNRKYEVPPRSLHINNLSQ